MNLDIGPDDGARARIFFAFDFSVSLCLCASVVSGFICVDVLLRKE